MGSHDDFDAGAAGGLDPYGERALDDGAAQNLAALVSQPSLPEQPRPPSDDETVSVRGAAVPADGAGPFTQGAAAPLFRSSPNTEELAARDHLARQGPLFDASPDAAPAGQPATSHTVPSVRPDDRRPTAADPMAPDTEASPPNGLRWSTVVHEPAEADTSISPSMPASSMSPSMAAASQAPAQRSLLVADRPSAPPPVPAMPVHETRLSDALAGLTAQRWFWSSAILVGAVAAMLVGFAVVQLWGPGSGGTIAQGVPSGSVGDAGVADTIPQGPMLSDTGSGLPGSDRSSTLVTVDPGARSATTAPVATVPTASTTALGSTSSSSTTSTTAASTTSSATSTSSTTSTTASTTTSSVTSSSSSSTTNPSSTTSTSGSSSTTDPSSTTSSSSSTTSSSSTSTSTSTTSTTAPSTGSTS